MNINELKGKTLFSVTTENRDDSDLPNVLKFLTQDGEEYELMHEQECCENVYIDDIDGDLSDLVGTPILLAEEVKNDAFVAEYADKNGNCKPDSYTWTFYKIATIKGYVTIRWFGESNGDHSESVDFVKTKSAKQPHVEVGAVEIQSNVIETLDGFCVIIDCIPGPGRNPLLWTYSPTEKSALAMYLDGYENSDARWVQMQRIHNARVEKVKITIESAEK